MKHLIYISSFLMLALLASCEQFRNSGGSASDSTQTAAPAPRFDTLSVSIRKSVVEGKEYPCYSISVNAILPDNETASRVLTERLFALKGMAPRQAMALFTDSLESQFSQELDEFSSLCDDDEEMEYEYHVNCSPVEPIDTASGVISFLCTFEVYQGGAHGGYECYYLNFSLNDGHLITLGEVYDGNPCPAMREKLLRDNGCRTDEELMDKTQILTLGQLYATDNFLIEGDSLLFHFNPYEIAPYSAGAIEVVIPCK